MGDGDTAWTLSKAIGAGDVHEPSAMEPSHTGRIYTVYIRMEILYKSTHNSTEGLSARDSSYDLSWNESSDTSSYTSEAVASRVSSYSPK